MTPLAAVRFSWPWVPWRCAGLAGPLAEATPATACGARPKAQPGDRTADTRWRVRTDTNGELTLRVTGRLRHMGIGRDHAPVLCSSAT